MAEKQAKQRFVALRVHEVSLVDRPANEQEFLVIKRHPISTETDMANKAQETAKQEEKAAETSATEKAETCKDCGKPVQFCKCEKAKAKKADETPAEAPAEKAKKADKEEEEESEDKKAKKAASDLATAEKALADAQALVESLKGKAPPFAKKPDEKEEEDKKAKKAVEATVEKGMSPKDMLISMMVEDMHSRLYKIQNLASMDVDTLLSTAKSLGIAPEKLAEMEAVSKGKKQFSGERLEKFNTALKTLLDLSGDVDKETLLKMIAPLTGGEAPEKGGEASPKPALPSTGATGDAGGYSAQSAVKAVEETVSKAVAALTEKLDATVKEIETLKSVRGVSKSLPADETEQPVSKADGFWKGVV